MKANEKIPEDEMLLAEAIATARSRRLGWCFDYMFEDADGVPVGSCQFVESKIAKCCAYGALVLSNRAPWHHGSRPNSLRHVGTGNDMSSYWSTYTNDFGESLGWAFRCAMEDA